MEGFGSKRAKLFKVIGIQTCPLAVQEEKSFLNLAVAELIYFLLQNLGTLWAVLGIMGAFGDSDSDWKMCPRWHDLFGCGCVLSKLV